MKVYIPFEDGSSISYDGGRFTIHKRPVGINADLSDLSGGTAEVMWHERRNELAKALKDAWWKEHEHRSKNKTKKIYSNVRTNE